MKSITCSKCAIGPFTWQKPKSKNLVFCCTVYTAEKPITFGVFGTKSACAKKPESHTDVLVSGAHARLLSTFDRTRVVCITSRAAGRVIPLKVTYHVTKYRITPCEIGAGVYIGKRPWKTRGVSKNPTPEVRFSILVFAVFRVVA